MVLVKDFREWSQRYLVARMSKNVVPIQTPRGNTVTDINMASNSGESNSSVKGKFYIDFQTICVVVKWGGACEESYSSLRYVYEYELMYSKLFRNFFISGLSEII